MAKNRSPLRTSGPARWLDRALPRARLAQRRRLQAAGTGTLRRRFLGQRPLKPGLRTKLIWWWSGVEVDVSYLPLASGLAAFLMFLKAIWSQPFTESLHWLWTALLVCVLTYIFYRFAIHVQAAQDRPIGQVLPDEETA